MARRKNAEHMTSEGRELLREIDQRITQSKRLTLIQMGYGGDRLEHMLRLLRGNPRKKKEKETDDG